MKGKFILIASTALLASLAVSCTSARSQSSTAATTGTPADNRPALAYNPQDVETIRGEVTRVERTRGVHLTVQTDSGAIPVALGPAWFIDNQLTQIRRGDQVEITGSRVTRDDRSALIASEVRKDSQVLHLRDETGRPAWAAWRSQGQPGPMPSRAMGGRGRMGPGMGGDMMRPGGPHAGMMAGGAGRCPCCGAAMGPGGMMGGMKRGKMMARCHEMLAHHEQMLTRWKAMESELDQKTATMNQATGQEKVDAMAGVINALVNQRKEVSNHFMAAHKRMSEHLQDMMGPEATQTNQPPSQAQ